MSYNTFFFTWIFIHLNLWFGGYQVCIPKQCGCQVHDHSFILLYKTIKEANSLPLCFLFSDLEKLVNVLELRNWFTQERKGKAPKVVQLPNG